MFKKIVLGVTLMACQSMAIGIAEEKKATTATTDAAAEKSTETTKDNKALAAVEKATAPADEEGTCELSDPKINAIGHRFLKKGLCPSVLRKLTKDDIKKQQELVK